MYFLCLNMSFDEVTAGGALPQVPAINGCIPNENLRTVVRPTESLLLFTISVFQQF